MARALKHDCPTNSALEDDLNVDSAKLAESEQSHDTDGEDEKKTVIPVTRCGCVRGERELLA